jgi:hypothetical protein
MGAAIRRLIARTSIRPELGRAPDQKEVNFRTAFFRLAESDVGNFHEGSLKFSTNS